MFACFPFGRRDKMNYPGPTAFADPLGPLVRYRSLRFSRDNGYAPDVSKGETLCQLFGPISDQFDSRVISLESLQLLRRKENSSWGIH
jgi:hypothetical protein